MREVGSSLHSNLLGCGWERLRPTVLTISPCSHKPHREQEGERVGWGGVRDTKGKFVVRESAQTSESEQLTCGERRLCQVITNENKEESDSFKKKGTT